MNFRQSVSYEAIHAARMQALAGRKLATFPVRMAALLIDFLLAGALFLGAILLAGKVANAIPSLRDAKADVKLELNFFDNWYSIIYLALFFGLSLYWGHGRTLGKRLMKIRVVSVAHDHLSLWTCMERGLGYGASALEFGFGFLQYFIHPNHQTVHDRIAETIVVDDRT